MSLSDSCDLYTWGDGTTGMLGHGENAEENVPRVVDALLSKNISTVACGVNHTIAVTSMFVVFIRMLFSISLRPFSILRLRWDRTFLQWK